MPLELGATENPRKWRFTWEAQSEVPTLRLYLFNPAIKPSTHCIDLKVHLQSLLTVSWCRNDGVEVFIGVPVPRVLVDDESPVQFRAVEDHIEVKLALLLPVDHPIVANFGRNESLEPLLVESDLKGLSSREGVHFYCRRCSAKLTKSLRKFEEMPSVNWREAADNWFGACCCSFGGISEKLVTRYANSYTCAKGMCLLSTTSVVVCKDDLLGCPFPNSDGSTKCEPEHDFAGEHSLSRGMLRSANIPATTVSSDNPRSEDFDGLCAVAEEVSSKVEDEVNGKAPDGERLSCMFRTCEVNENGASASGCCINKKSYIRDHDSGCCTLDASISSAKDPKSTTTTGIPGDRKSFLNGFLGNAFMARSSNLSKEVQWTEFLCPQCSCLLGAYPCADGNSPLDGGVRFFKSYISTCLPVGGSDDLFRKYTLEAMFTNQLLENAKDELSYRTVARDLQSKRPMLQIVLLNPDSWCCSGDCSTMEPKIDMYPSVKVLFSDCCDFTEVQLRGTEEWVTKNQADEVYMLASQVKELIESLSSANNILPPSHTLLQGFTISSLRR